MRYVLLIFILLLSFPFDVNAQGEDEHNKSLLWQISGRDMQQPSYLFGTIHIICKDKFLWTNAMQESFKAAEEICMEMDMDDPSIIMETATAMMNKDGKQLKDYFTDEEYAVVQQYFLDSIGMNIDMLAGMKPIVLQTLLATDAGICDSAVSYELILSDSANKYKKEITGLETPAEQIGLLDKIPADSIIKEIVAIAKGKTDDLTEYRAMIQAYVEQDIPQLHEIILKSKEEGDNLDAFLSERNAKWIDRMTERMDQKSVFFAVGAGHLWGEDGVISLLRKEGYTVIPIH